MKQENWKTIAIIFIILFILETLFLALSILFVIHEEKMIKECYYNFCSEYPYADYIDGVCYCYDYNMLGELDIIKTKVLN